MLHVDDQPETLHIYVVRDEAPKPQFFPIVLSVLALASIVALSVAFPYQQPVTRSTIRVPAVPLGIRTFTANIVVVPTGLKKFPATTAYGVLTITNGSIIGQSIPAGFTIQGVVTDTAVYVPPGNANGYGWATVSAHALASGVAGNIPTLSVNQVIGSSVYVRNLSAFSGGRNAYSVKFITSNDRSNALSKIRNKFISKITALHYPCQENHFADSHIMRVSWRCQFLTYQLPAFMHVTGIKIIGKNLLLTVWFVPRPVRYWVK
jgi:hypothetical protein